MSDLFDALNTARQTETQFSPIADDGRMDIGGVKIDLKSAEHIIVSALEDEEERNFKARIAESAELDPAIDVSQAYARWDTAKAYAKMYNVPRSEAFANLERYDSDFFGRTPDYKTAPKAILDAGLAQVESMKIGKLYTELMLAEGLNGLIPGEGQVFSGPTAERAAEIEAEIEAIKEKMSGYSSDIIPRGALVSLAKKISSATPYTVSILGTTAAAGAAVTAAGATFGLSSGLAMATIKSSIVSLVGFTAGFRIMVGLEYGEMIDRGIDPKEAAKWATLSGAGQAAIEQFLGIEGAISGKMSKGVIGRVTERFIEKLHVSGALTTAAKIYGARVAFSAIGEAGEEGGGALLSGIATLMAQSATEEGLVIDPIRASTIAKNIATSMIEAAITAPFLGLAPDILMTISDTKKLSKLAGMAPVLPKEEFIDYGMESGALDGVELPDDKKRAALGTLYDHQTKTAEEQALAGAEATRKAATEGAKPESVVRRDDGTLRVDAEDSGITSDGTQSVTFTAGAARGKGDVYGSMSAKVTEDTVTLTDSDIDAEHLPLAGEVIGQIAARYPGRQILIGEKADEGIKAAYEQFVRERTDNPFVESDTRDPEVATLLEQHRSKLLADGVDRKAVSVAVAMFDIMSQAGANRTGKSQAEFLRSFDVAGNYVDGTFPPDTKVGGYLSKYKLASLDASSTKFAKAIIAIFSKSDPVYQVETASHEPVHLFRSWMSDNARDGIFSEFEKEYGVVDGKWTEEADELFVEDWTRWLREKQAVTGAKSTIFERLSRLLRALYTSMTGYAPLPPKLRAEFDSLMEGVSVEVAKKGWNTDERASAPYITRGERGEHPVTQKYREAEKARYDVSQKIIADAAKAQGEADFKATEEALKEAAAQYKDDLQVELEAAVQPPASVLTAPLTEDGEHFAETPEAEKTTSALNKERFETVEYDLARIEHDPELKNFKRMANKKTGVVIPIHSDKYERMGTAPIVIWERLDGRTVIVTGRHRLDLAKRLGEQTIPSQIVTEAEGFTLAMAKAFDAESNIRDEQGSVEDYVTYFRFSGISESDARAKGLLGRTKGSAGFAIANYASEGLYSLYMAGDITETRAAVIATVGRGKPWLQAEGIKVAKNKNMSIDSLASYLEVAGMETSGGMGDVDGGFGEDDWFKNDADAIAQQKRWLSMGEAVANRMAELRNEERLLNAGIKSGGASAKEYLEKYGSRSGDIESMKKRYEELYFELKGWESGWTQNPYRVNEAKKLAGLKYDETLVEPDLRVRDRDKEERGQEMLFNISERSAIEARQAQIEDGTWVANPQLVAEIKVSKGIELSQYESDLLSVAEQYSESNGKPDLLFNISGDNTGEKRAYADQFAEARNYASFESWLDAMFASKEALTENDREWLRARYENAQSTLNKPRKYAKSGDFAKAMSTRGGVASFVSQLERAIYGRGRYESDVTKARAKKIESAISRTPELKRLVGELHTEGKVPSPQSARQLLRDMKEYEALYKYLYAVLQTDEVLAHEALDDMKEVPELIKRELTGNAARTIAEQQYIIDALRFDQKYDRIASGEATLSDIDAFIEDVKAFKDEEMEEFADSAKAEAKLAMDRQKDKERARDALRKLRSEMARLRKFIFTEPSARIDLEQASVIRYIQQYLRAGKPVDPKSLRMAGSYIFTSMPGLAEVIAQSVDSVSGKDFSQWSMDEVRSIASIMADLADLGREALRGKELEFGYNAKSKRGLINSAMRNSKYHLPPVMKDSEEDIERRGKNRLRKALFDADRPDAWIKKYLGKDAYDLLFSNTVDAHRLKYENYDRRINPVVDYIDKHDMVKSGSMFRKIFARGIGPEGTDATITGAELLGIRLLYGDYHGGNDYNTEQREAFIYGNLFSADEKNVDGNLTQERELATNQKMRDAYKEKCEKVEALLKANLSAEEEELARLMVGVSDNDQDWGRFAKAIYMLTNKEPSKNRFYFPIFRSGVFGKGEDDIIDSLAASGMTVALDQGMAISRVAIQPRNQRPVQINAMKVFFSAVEKQEHLINVGLHAKLLHGVFMNQTMGDAVLPNIDQSLGKEAVDYIKNQIDTITNPSHWSEKASGGKLLGAARGSIVISNLAFRWSSVVMQGLTSQLPFLSEVSAAQLLAVSTEAMTDMPEFTKRMEAESAILRHRQMTAEVAYLEQRIEQGVASKLEKLSQIGMKPLTWIDRYSVAIGWEAVRRAELDEFLSKGVEENDAKLAASAYADEVIIKTQPTSEEVYRSPMYRNMNEYKQLVLQFTQPLNVIWNNLRNDIPDAVREHEFRKYMGFIAAYALSGIAVSAIAVARGRGPDDPDEEKWLRYFLHATTTQFTDSIPLVGGIATLLTRKAIVGDTGYLNDMNMPAASGIARAGVMMLGQDPDYGKVAKTLGTSIGLFVGAPVKGALDVWELGKAIAGEE